MTDNNLADHIHPEMTDNNLADYKHKELSGKNFYKLFPNLSKRLIKLTNDKENHNGFQFITGLNEDTVPFNPIDECRSGGIYFTDIDNLPRWLNYNEKSMKYCRTVTLPPDCRVYIEKDKFKANKIILSERVEIEKLDCWLDEEYCLKAMGFNNFQSWQYIKNENALFEAINKGISIAYMLANQATISEKVIRYSMSIDINYSLVDRSAEYSKAIIYASKYGYLEVVKFLLSDEIREKYPQIDPSKNNNDAIILASCHGHLEIVKFLLSDEIWEKYPGINPGAKDNHAIRLASYNGHIEVVKLILSDEISAKYPNMHHNDSDNIAIISASGHSEVVKSFLSDHIISKYPNIDPSANNNEAIRLASSGGHIELVKFLLSDEITAKYPNIDPSAENNYAIRGAYSNGHMEIVKLLSQDKRVIKKGIPQYINIIFTTDQEINSKEYEINKKIASGYNVILM